MGSSAPAQYQVHGFEAVVASESMRKIMQMVERVARANASVLISGETGCGKEFIARALHHHSLRCAKPWVDVNCAALPEHLVESELFGYEKGAFSGADSMKQGLFELAHGGTLFLDEIGELEPKVQVKLLRVLDNVPYYRLGGNKKVSVDVRVIAATNQDLEIAVKAGRFRGDLYHRLCQVQLRIPPLRERPDDINALAQFFLNQHAPGCKFSEEAMEALRRHPWMGNVRELRNAVIQISMVADGNVIEAAALPPEILQSQGAAEPKRKSMGAGPNVTAASEVADLAELEKHTILNTLASTGGHQGIAAEKLGISRRTLSRKLKQYQTESTKGGSDDGLGFLNREQQQYFRASVEIPVTITSSGGDETEVVTVNISSGGMCVTGIQNPLQCAGNIKVGFTLPDGDLTVETKAVVAWADAEKKAGLMFLDFPADAQIKLNRWLHNRLQEEGWTFATSRGVGAYVS
ncbi:MAG TPA: sigma 54-interacting transcriptional regulator [Terriglobales bacterium]|nr:sigma 54-interacting transcriptional regulator [Terriglobales bacterium]